MSKWPPGGVEASNTKTFHVELCLQFAKECFQQCQRAPQYTELKYFIIFLKCPEKNNLWKIDVKITICPKNMKNSKNIKLKKHHSQIASPIDSET